MKKQTVFFIFGIIALILVVALYAVSLNVYYDQIALTAESYAMAESDVIALMPYISTTFLDYSVPMCLMLILAFILFIGNALVKYFKMFFENIALEEIEEKK